MVIKNLVIQKVILKVSESVPAAPEGTRWRTQYVFGNIVNGGLQYLVNNCKDQLLGTFEYLLNTKSTTVSSIKYDSKSYTYIVGTISSVPLSYIHRHAASSTSSYFTPGAVLTERRVEER